jgi:aspartate/methionine/tyrosine aminotransferase
VVKNPELAEIQDICRDRATLVMDEFYGGYNYTSNCDGTTISAAENIEDVDEDDVLIIDGLTKRFRLPGWRIAWIVGPKVLPLSHLHHEYIKRANEPRNSSKPSAPADPTLMAAPMSRSSK